MELLNCQNCGKEAKKTQYCKYCGTKISDATKWCGNCGAKIDDIVSEGNRFKKNIIMHLIIGFILFFIGYGGIHECDECGKISIVAYYDINYNEDKATLCGTCAKDYWDSLNYRIYRIRHF